MPTNGLPSNQSFAFNLIKEPHDLSAGSLVLGLVVVQNALGGGQDEVAELSGGEDVGGPSLQVVQWTSNLGEMTPHLLILPRSSTTIFPDLWSSMTSNSPMYPLFCISFRNLIRTFELGLKRTWLAYLPLSLTFRVEDAL